MCSSRGKGKGGRGAPSPKRRMREVWFHRGTSGWPLTRRTTQSYTKHLIPSVLREEQKGELCGSEPRICRLITLPTSQIPVTNLGTADLPFLVNCWCSVCLSASCLKVPLVERVQIPPFQMLSISRTDAVRPQRQKLLDVNSEPSRWVLQELLAPLGPYHDEVPQ